MKYLGLLLLFFLSSAKAGPGLVIGNSSDGYRIGGSVWLRDFTRAGLGSSLYWGKSADPDLIFQVQSLMIPLPFSRMLLASKLADLNLVAPHLGDYLRVALEAFDWTPVEGPLLEIPDTSYDISPPPPGAEHVQIANRYLSHIYVDKNLWSKMPESHKIGLLIHEAIYALLRLECDGYRCQQMHRVASELTEMSFSSILIQATGRDILKQSMSKYLSITLPKSDTEPLRASTELVLSVFEAADKGAAMTLINRWQLPLKNSESDVQRQSLALCRLAHSYYSQDKFRVWKIDVNLPTYKIIVAPYRSDRGEQNRLILKSLSLQNRMLLESMMLPPNKATCFNMSEVLNEALREAPP